MKFFLNVLPLLAFPSNIHCFTTLSHWVYHCSPVTFALGMRDVSQHECALALWAYSFFSNTTSTSTRSPGPGRRHLMVNCSVTLLALGWLCKFSFMAAKLFSVPLYLPASIRTFRSSQTGGMSCFGATLPFLSACVLLAAAVLTASL